MGAKVRSLALPDGWRGAVQVCNLAAEGRMENERCGLCKVCGVREEGYDGV